MTRRAKAPPRRKDPAEGAAALEAFRRRRLDRLCSALELDAFEAGLILELLERVEELERDLRRFRALP